jgi:hypothetical protein
MNYNLSILPFLGFPFNVKSSIARDAGVPGRLRDGIGKVGDRCVAAVMPSYGHRVGRDNSGQALENDSMRRLAPSLAEIEELANRALATIPAAAAGGADMVARVKCARSPLLPPRLAVALAVKPGKPYRPLVPPASHPTKWRTTTTIPAHAPRLNATADQRMIMECQSISFMAPP